MTTTDLHIKENCPTGTTVSFHELETPNVIFKVYSTPECANLHTSHLKYTTGGNSHLKVYEAEVEVPADTLTITFKWRSPNIQEEITCSPNVTQQPDSPNAETRATFAVPPLNQPATTWVVSGQSPGFKLTVTVKRKP